MPECDPNVVFLLPANFIKKPNSKTLRKQNRAASGPSVLSNIICGFKELVKPQPKHSNRHSYHDYNDPASNAPSTKRSLTPELFNQSDGKMNSRFPSSISSPNLSKQDSGSSSTGSSSRHQDLIHFNEDYSRSVEDREKKMEERRMSSRGSSGSSSTNGEIRTPKSKKRTLQLPNAPNRDIKPSTILRLPDRDLVVIDRHDIKEAVNNESQVIIVDPPAIPSTASEKENTVDLGDILGGAWPELQTGASAAILNADKKAGSVGQAMNGWKTVERNKSANIASHFSNSKPRRFDNGYDPNTQKKSE